MKNRKVLLVTIGFIAGIYVFSLCKTLGYYQQAGKFSKEYLRIINTASVGTQHFYLINQPAQHHGALMLRAQSRLPNTGSNQYTIVNEYIQNLYGNYQTKFITLSANPLQKVTEAVHVIAVSIENINNYYPSFIVDKNRGILKADTSVQPFIFNKDGIAALRNDTLFVFK